VEVARQLQAVNGDCLRSALNLYGIGLIASVEDSVWAEIRGLEGSPEGIMPYKDMRGGGQVLENEGGWRSMPGCWYGPKLSNVDPQSRRDVGDFGACGE
jgi:hypothetical protein